MFDEMAKWLGRKLKAEYRDSVDSEGRIITRPDHCGPMTHINMYIHFDKDFRVVDFSGDKCYSYSTGLYNRSHDVRDGHFTAKDFAYWRKFVKEITE